MKVARIYLRVSTDEQDLTRQEGIEHSSQAAGYYIAGVYREKASGTRADRPELLLCGTRDAKIQAHIRQHDESARPASAKN